MEQSEWKILDHVPLGIFVIDRNYRILFWNRCLSDWTRLRKEEVLYGSLLHFFPRLTASKYTSRLKDLFSGGPPVIFSSQLHPGLLTTLNEENSRYINHVTVSSVPTDQKGEYLALFAVENVTELSQKVREARELQRLSDDLMKELNHRVKNHLTMVASFILLQEDFIDDPKAKNIMDNLRNRIQSISLLHEKLYMHFNQGKVEIVEYIEELIHQLELALKQKTAKVTFNKPVQSISLGGDRALYLGLVVNELVTNALKYATGLDKEKDVLVSLESHGAEFLVLKVTDQGPGLPSDFSLEKSKGLGSTLIHSLVQSLKGKLTFETSDKGTAFSLKVDITL